MLGRISWWIVENVLWPIGLYSPPAPPALLMEPTGVRQRTESILAWKRCSICGSILITAPGQLEFLTTNRNLHSESYLVVCADRHPYYVTIFLQGTVSMPILAQDEVWPFLPKSCGSRSVTYGRVEMFLPERWASELKIEGRCGVKGHQHDVYLRWYEKPGWTTRTSQFAVRG